MDDSVELIDLPSGVATSRDSNGVTILGGLKVSARCSDAIR